MSMVLGNSPASPETHDALRVQIAILQAQLDAVEREKCEQEIAFNRQILLLEREIHSLRQIKMRVTPKWFRPLSRPAKGAPKPRAIVTSEEDSSTKQRGIFHRIVSFISLVRLRGFWRPRHKTPEPVSESMEWHAMFDNGRVCFVNKNDSRAVHLDHLVESPQKSSSSRVQDQFGGDSSWV
ncbi:unnamed protein product [Aphanomyces euteiches]|uniref:Uncharacterized protein n=1 Tax=Aphanomyces euteiches TaxID=100861 RepID=A0A6G0XEW7_9STRA|nr:hypothetical protein Ae201684_005367 [Aphanomyces euteiches]KAH9092559.1 hypothetical protein Ae201684P_008233 [Aphanomyces euteiches]KAH9157686.1 hypothetical protein AeRB84_000496 [Aphanomyces euteiches]